MTNHNLDRKHTSLPQQSNFYAILDSGASDHYLKQNPETNKVSQDNYDPITVTLPNGTSLKSTERCTLPIPLMSNKATTAHVIPKLNKSLISIGKLCDANYTAVFTNKDVKICRNPIQIPQQDILLTGKRDATNGLYITQLQNNKSYFANKIDGMHHATTKNAITFLYLAAFSPAISTLTMAIKKGFFKSWPGFTVEAVHKYVANMPHVHAGRMDHVRKNVRSTKLKQIVNNTYMT